MPDSQTPSAQTPSAQAADAQTASAQTANAESLAEQAQRAFHAARYREAHAALTRLVALTPEAASAWSNLGYVSYLLGDLESAVAQLDRALRLDAQQPGTWSNLAIVQLKRQQPDAAAEAVERGLRLDPEMAELWTNLGLVRQQQQRYSEAVQALTRALQLRPTLADAQVNLAACYQDMGRADEAARLYAELLAREPGQRAAISNRLMCLQYLPSLTSGELREAARTTTRPLHPAHTPPRGTLRNPARPIIGLVSGDFRAHPVGWFLVRQFEHLATLTPCICYADQTQHDPITARFRAAAHAFRPITGLDDAEVAAQVATDGVAILIDLAGHTAGNRLGLFAQRAAPLQLSWLGYPASSGIDAMDGLILGRDLVSAAAQSYCTERLLPLDAPPFVFTPPDYLPPVAPLPALRNGHVTFGCFNNLAKLNDATLVLWAQLLHRVAESRLLLKGKALADLGVREQLLRRLHALGIHQGRVELRPASAHATMLAEYADIDIALDTHPFGGALTSYEAVWMGVPVVTLYGPRPLSRQSMAMNAALGLDRLNATTPKAYVEAAANLAADLDALAALRAGLRGHANASPLSDWKDQAERLFACLTRLSTEKLSADDAN